MSVATGPRDAAGRRPAAARVVAALALSLLAAAASAQQVPPAPIALRVEDAVATGLAADPGLLSAALDARAAEARALDARLRMLPSIALSAGYARLSQEPSPAPSSTGSATVDGVVNALMKMLTGAPSDSKDIRLDLQYPVFAGFRLKEAAEIARLQSLGKSASAELGRRALAFEIRRAYWEALRASASVDTLRKGLELESAAKDEVASLSAQGMASETDRLGEQARYDQASLALDDALSAKELATLVLSSLIGDTNARRLAPAGYDLVSAPGAEPLSPDLGDEGALLAGALANRPETRAAAIALGASAAARVAAKADLYPSLALTGSLSYADPDPRLFPAQDKFNLSWSIGARLRYDIGALPGALERGKAAEADLEKAGSDLERQRNAVALDLRRCVLTLKRTRNSLELTRDMVGPAEEARRAAEAKYRNGMAKRSELLQAEMALLRAGLAVTSRAVDEEIARADLLRAAALD